MTQTPIDPGPRVTRDDVLDFARLRRTSADRKIAGVAGGIGRHLDIDPLIVRVALVVLAFFGGAGLVLYFVGWALIPADDRTEASIALSDRGRVAALWGTLIVAGLLIVGDVFGGSGHGGGWAVIPLLAIGAIVWLVTRGRRRNGESSDTTAQRTGPVLFGVVVALIAIAFGAIGIASVAGVEIAPSVYPATALALSAVGLIVGAFWGRAGGLIALGSVSAVLTFGATGAHSWHHGAWNAGDVTETPSSATALAPSYRHDAGDLRLDLSRIEDLDNLAGRTLTIDSGVGQVEVIVPRNLDVRVDAKVGGPGNVRLFGGADEGGIHVQRSAFQDAPNTTNELRIDARIGVGEIFVHN